MPQFVLSIPGDLETLGRRWRALEAEADTSFFQSWTWLGCEAAARFPDPVLIEAIHDGRTMGLALCNRRSGWLRDTLWLGESGDAGWDSVFVEHNGPLVVRDAGPEVVAGMLDAALHPSGRRLVLSGVREDIAAIARKRPGTTERQPDRTSPFLDFASIRAAGRDPMTGLSSNSRQQLRRSLRLYAAQGPLVVTPASDAAEALTFLDRLAALHQESWQRRGKPGAFSVPEFLRFHRALLARAVPRGEAELLHVTAGGQTIGYLYNFIWRGWVLAYQSGFAYPEGDTHRKPGLTCHHLAIATHFAAGRAGYDFLAGDARYKTSFANATRTLSWLQIGAASKWIRWTRRPW